MYMIRTTYALRGKRGEDKEKWYEGRRKRRKQ